MAFSGETWGKVKKWVPEQINLYLTSGAVPKGSWDASTNTPHIEDGTGTTGWYYDVTVAGTWNGIQFLVGDRVIYTPNNRWERVATGQESENPMVIEYIDQTTTALPSTRKSGNALKVGDWVQVKSTAILPFTVGGLVFDSYSDKAEWTGSAWQLADFRLGKTNEVEVYDKTSESYSKTKEIQSDINIELVTQIKNCIIESNDLNTIAVADIEKRPYFQKVDTTARKAGIYWYNSTSTATDKWEKMGGAGGIADGDTLPTTASENDWFYLKQDQTVGTETYYIGVYRYNGTKWEFQFGTKDITESFKTKNPTITFDSGTSLLKVGKRFNIATTMTLQTPVTDRQSAERKIATLPDDCTTTGSFYGDLTTKGGQQTSEENRKEFYDPTGSHYINPSSFTTFKVSVNGCADIRSKFVSETFIESETPITGKITHNTTTGKWYNGTDQITVENVAELPTYSDSAYLYIAVTNKLYRMDMYYAPQRINDSTYALWFNEDGTPDFAHTVLEIDSTKDYYVFRMHLPKTETGNIYKKVKDMGGTQVYKYVPCYQMDRIAVKCSTAFLYQYELQKQGCNIDSTGKFCDVTIEESYESAKFHISQPFAGTVTWTPKTYTEESRLERISVHGKGIYVRGNTSIKSICLGGTF